MHRTSVVVIGAGQAGLAVVAKVLEDLHGRRTSVGSAA
jgi:cation diffusion facilitator CzcD-associated flavoprotein CzcO